MYFIPRVCTLYKGCVIYPKGVYFIARVCTLPKGCVIYPKGVYFTQRMCNLPQGCVIYSKDMKQKFVSGLSWTPPQDGDSSQFYSSASGCAPESVWTLRRGYEGWWGCRHTVRERLCYSLCEIVDDGKDLNSGGRTCTNVYDCHSSVELNTCYGGSSKNRVRLQRVND